MIVWLVLGGSPFESVVMEAGEQRLMVSYERYGPEGSQQIKDLARIASDRIKHHKTNPRKPQLGETQ